MITNILINDLLMLCHKNRIDIEEWYEFPLTISLNCYCELPQLVFSAIHPNDMAELMEMLQSETINLNLLRLILQEMLIGDVKQSPKDVLHFFCHSSLLSQSLMFLLPDCQSKRMETNKEYRRDY